MENLNYTIEKGPHNGHSADVGINNSMNYINKEEKIFQRLLNEKRELQKKKSNIESRLVEIQNDLNIRREEIRSGR